MAKRKSKRNLRNLGITLAADLVDRLDLWAAEQPMSPSRSQCIAAAVLEFLDNRVAAYPAEIKFEKNQAE